MVTEEEEQRMEARAKEVVKGIRTGDTSKIVLPKKKDSVNIEKKISNGKPFQ